MQVSVDWLRDYTKPKASVHQIADRLTMTVNEVEDIVSLDELTEIRVGEVIELAPHPGADNLWLTKTKVGDQVHSIICGADNLVVGAKVPVALPGVTLPTGVLIGRRMIRGKRSEGMLCSPRELGLGEDHSGIWLLPADSRSGQRLPAALKGRHDSFELEVLANRPDLMGHLGVAREVAAACGVALKEPRLKTPPRPKPGKYSATLAPGSSRFSLAVMRGVRNRPSPAWLQARLNAVGVRPISAVVDVTNFVMLESAQPLHAYDAAKLRGATIAVRRAKPREALTTLDGQRRRLDRDTLVIADRSGAIGLAGIMGGAATEVGATTTDIVVEAAHFDAATVRRTARRLGLRTEASARFEKGLSASFTLPAIRRAVDLLQEVCGGTLEQLTDAYPKPGKPLRLALDPASLSDFLGTTVSGRQASQALRGLGYGVRGTRKLQVGVPEWRTDIHEPVDLYEEVARQIGYDQLPASLPRAQLTVPSVPPLHRLSKTARETLVASGFTEVVTHSLVGEALLRKDAPGGKIEAVKTANPLSEDHAYLRDGLTARHLEAAEANLRWCSTVRFFEIGRVFQAAPESRRLPTERTHLLVTVATKGQEDCFAQVRGALASLFRTLKISESAVVWNDIPNDNHAPGRSFTIDVNGHYLGYLAERAPNHGFKIGRVWMAELSLNHLLPELPLEWGVTEAPKFPAIQRDLSVYMPGSRRYADLRRLLLKHAPETLASVGRPRQFEHRGRRSLTVSLEFRAAERTLTDAEVNQAMSRLLKRVAAAGYEIRE